MAIVARRGEKSEMLPRKQRIYEIVTDSRNHPTAQDVFDAIRGQMPRISLATVYRNLNELAEEGKIIRIEAGGSPDRFDRSGVPHDHLVCLSCGKIVDMPSIAHCATPPEGCIISFCKLIAYGYCPACALQCGNAQEASQTEVTHGKAG